MKVKALIICIFLAIIVSSSFLLFASEAIESVAMSPVVSTEWLAEHIEDPDLIILHMGPSGSFEERHIPGARSASLRRMIRVNEAGIRDEMLAVKDIAKALSELGITDSSRIVVYFAEEGAAWAAARYLLTLEYIGMAGSVAYLDGGLPKWAAEEHPVSSELPSIDTTDITVTAVENVLVDTEWLASRYEKPGIAVLDGRPTEGYSGLAGHWDRLGHIPGAGSIPFFTLLAQEPSYLLKNLEELSDMFREAGVMPGDTVVVYCGTGLWASLPYLAARHLGCEVRLYDASFQEWSATENLPVVASEKGEDSD